MVSSMSVAIDAAQVQVVSAAASRDGCKHCACLFFFDMLDLLANIMIDCAANNCGAGECAWRQSELRT